MEDKIDLRWRKSSYSGQGGGNCVEVASHDGMILVRDSKDRGRGPAHTYSAAEWHTFIAGIRNGQYDLTEPRQQP
jgi:hypothetical protein